MAKVFLSFLGTSNYVPCIYYRDDFRFKNVRFIQEATTRLACKAWTDADRILIFTTEEACRKNWANNGHINTDTENGIEMKGLEECLSGIGLPCPVKRVHIPEGKTEGEIWEIFDIVFEELEEGDKITFDITHAFRSIPMLAIIILNYAKVMKNVTLESVYYGAFEVLGTPAEVKQMDLEDRLAPIFDLTPFVRLMDWTVAVDRFVKAGDAGLINALARGGLKRILSESKGKDRNAAAIRDVGQTLDSFCSAMTTCREPEISTIAGKLKSLMRQCEDTDLLPPFKPLFKMLLENIEPFRGEDFSDGVAAAAWCLEHNLVQQSATILREAVITRLVSLLERDFNNPEERKIAAESINIAYDQMFGKKPEGSGWEDVEKRVEAYVRVCERNRDLVKCWRPLTQLRNDLNHAGYVEDRKKPGTFANKLPGIIDRLRRECSPS